MFYNDLRTVRLQQIKEDLNAWISLESRSLSVTTMLKNVDIFG